MRVTEKKDTKEILAAFFFKLTHFLSFLMTKKISLGKKKYDSLFKYTHIHLHTFL